MSDQIISAREISDLLKYDKRDVLDDIISNARKTILAGHKVIIRETYQNAPPQDLKTFTTVGEIDAWVEDIDLLDDINSIKR
jgi:hypothetical protein